MWLKTIEIMNFRMCSSTRMELTKDLTVLVGPNGAGKSNIIDAIRLSTFPIPNSDRLSFEPSKDLSKSSDKKTSEIRLNFAGLSERESADFGVYLSTDGSLSITTELNGKETTLDRLRVSRRLGDPPYQEDRALSDRVGHLYLPPLRDAVAEMDKGISRRLVRILKDLSTDKQIVELSETSENLLREFAKIHSIANLQTLIQDHLSELTHPVREQVVTLEGAELAVDQLLRLINVFLASMNLDPMSVSAAGLGYANLLYIATVFISLEKQREHDLQILLVEEPEAHLHPQLQSVLLRYLLKRTRTDPKIQVIVTTHSPNITSAVPIENIVLVNVSNQIDPEQSGMVSTKCFPLNHPSLSDRNRRKINRFLDVTKSSLLFSDKVILVEGLAEALLIKCIAEHHVLKGNPVHQEKFEAVTVVSIDGVDFEPYLDLLLGGPSAMPSKVIVVTDEDGNAGESRSQRYRDKYATYSESSILSVHVSCSTLEADLFGHKENSDLLREAFLEMHPNSIEKWERLCDNNQCADQEQRVATFANALKNELVRLKKGEFAQRIVELIDSCPTREFVCPDYLRNAIEASIEAS